MIYFISGGAKNGKSMLAQTKAKELSDANDKKLYYIATMEPCDEEDHARIKRHVAERDGWGFETIESPRDLQKLITEDKIQEGAVILLDSLTALVANEMFMNGDINEAASEKIIAELKFLAEKKTHMVVVSDYIYSEKYSDKEDDKYTMLYLKALSDCDKYMAQVADIVIEVAFGNKKYIKGEEFELYGQVPVNIDEVHEEEVKKQKSLREKTKQSLNYKDFDFITAFFMAWGNFLALPCPYKKWKSSQNKLMLGFFPYVGIIIGLIWLAGVHIVKAHFDLPISLLAIASTFYCYSICGYMHLDGYMDCKDAMLSRRSREDKLRILKDSGVGAFSVISLIFLLLTSFLVQLLLLGDLIYTANMVIYLLIPILSRGTSASWLLICNRLPISQYYTAEQHIDSHDDKNTSLNDNAKMMRSSISKNDKIILSIIWVSISMIIIAAMLITLKFALILATLIVVVLSSLIAAYRCYRHFGGVSGDVSGYCICISELSGFLLACLGLYFGYL